MGVVGNFIGQIGQLRFQAGLLQAWFPGRLRDETMRHAAGLARLDMAGVTPGAVLEDALARLEGQVQAVVGRVTFFQRIDDAQAL